MKKELIAAFVCAMSFVGAASVSAAAPNTNPSCGFANGVEIASRPTSGLCANGTASTVFRTGGGKTWRYEWSCRTGSGSTRKWMSCSAPTSNKLRVDGECSGQINGKSTADIALYTSGQKHGYLSDSSACTNGYVMGGQGIGTFTISSKGIHYSCNGWGGGQYARCFIPFEKSSTSGQVDYGKCGSIYNQKTAQKPSTNLCASGQASEVSESRDYYYWTCTGYLSSKTCKSLK